MGLGSGKKPRPKKLSGTPDKSTNRSRSIVQEKRFAKKTGSRTTKNSGALPHPGGKGDRQDGVFCWEDKMTMHKAIRISSRTLWKITREASALDLIPALGVTVEGLPSNIEQDWVCIPLHAYEEILERVVREWEEDERKSSDIHRWGDKKTKG